MKAAYRQRLLNIGQALETKLRHQGVGWPFMAFRNTDNSTLRDTPQSEIDAARDAGRPVIIINFVRSDGDGQRADELTVLNAPGCRPAFRIALPAPGEPQDEVDAELKQLVEREVTKASVWERL